MVSDKEESNNCPNIVVQLGCYVRISASLSRINICIVQPQFKKNLQKLFRTETKA